jgi:hypothetical protein
MPPGKKSWNSNSMQNRPFQTALLALLPACVGAHAQRPEITLKPDDAGQWRFFVDGAEFPLKGAGGAIEPGLLEKLKKAGGNVVRTWGIETREHAYDGGDAESVPVSFPHLVLRNHEPECRFVAPDAAGDYRLFLVATDGRGNAATANFPFRVEP